MSRAQLVGLALLLLPAALHAQGGEASVEMFANLLAAEDARRFDQAVFSRALADPDSTVRRAAAMAVGRIRDPRGVPLLAPLLLDPDPLVEGTTIFALGILGDSSAVPLLTARARDPLPLPGAAALELITAAARLGGADGAQFVRSVLERTIWADRDDQPALLQRAALESWRLGKLAPVDQLLGLMRSTSADTRFAATYSLGRLRVPAAANRLIDALSDNDAPLVRAAAVRALTKSYADSAGLGADAVADLLARAVRDPDAGVRTTAIRTLSGFHLARLAGKVSALLDDPNLNVQVEAARALGELGGTGAVEDLVGVLASGKGTFARRREALLSLARVDSAGFAARVGTWTTSPDWRQRGAAAEGWSWVDLAHLALFLDDRDPRVVAAALQAWTDRRKDPDPGFVTACRRLLTRPDAAVRSLAADGVGAGGAPADIPALAAAYTRAARDSFPEAALSALGAIVAIGEAHPTERDALEHQALTTIPRPESYLVRRWAENNWPAAAQMWGAAYPIETRRTMADYREIARRYLLGNDTTASPHVKIDVDGVGIVELQLYGADAPLTVANFLSLVDRRYFDGQRFHRVVPNFVVQAGDPRGDGWGGPGSAIRDEINPRRYAAFVVGMALSGPDTGGSQWFITLSAQPHLDGGYTVFGAVASGAALLIRVTQGDLIRTIRR